VYAPRDGDAESCMCVYYDGRGKELRGSIGKRGEGVWGGLAPSAEGDDKRLVLEPGEALVCVSWGSKGEFAVATSRRLIIM